MLNIILVFILLSVSYEKSKVFYIKKINSSNIVKMFKLLNITLGNKIGLKVHSGEYNRTYYLKREFLEDIYNETNGTFIECNTAYEGVRSTTEKHKKHLNDSHWTSDKKTRFEIMDDDPNEDINLTIKDPVVIENNIVGGKIKIFDSCLVLTHFKGHLGAGFGGALKQLSVGFASQRGKAWIHSAGNTTDWKKWKYYPASKDNFIAALGDAASSIVEYFRNKSGIAFINVMSNITFDCDCVANSDRKPEICDYGILASLDPVALDKACNDLIIKSSSNGTKYWIKQLEDTHGENIFKVAEAHGIGTQEYELIEIKDDNKTNLIIVLISTIAGVSLFVGTFVGLIMKKPKSKTQEDFHLTQKMNE